MVLVTFVWIAVLLYTPDLYASEVPLSDGDLYLAPALEETTQDEMVSEEPKEPVVINHVSEPLPKSLIPESLPGQPVVRIKDIARVQGVRSNQLVGLGLVVGLSGTGDGRGASAQMVRNMLERFGITVSESDLRMRNVAVVTVSAELPPFARPGDTIDVTVSSLGDAKSLEGGLLLQTPLQAADGEVYAVAQGAVSIGGFNASGGGTSVSKNHPTVGRIPSGAIVEGQVTGDLMANGRITWLLDQADFATASRVAAVINQVFAPDTARAVDGGAVVVKVPEQYGDRLVEFITTIGELPVATDTAAKVVINERTGTVVIGHRVRIATVAVSHGGLTVRVETSQNISQPPAFSEGETVVTTQTDVQVDEEPARMTVLRSGADVEDLVKALNAVGATPRDVIAILQAIKEAGALYGELETM